MSILLTATIAIFMDCPVKQKLRQRGHGDTGKVGCKYHDIAYLFGLTCAAVGNRCRLDLQRRLFYFVGANGKTGAGTGALAQR